MISLLNAAGEIFPQTLVFKGVENSELMLRFLHTMIAPLYIQFKRIAGLMPKF